MAYVYKHTRIDTGEVFYIGIGKTNNYARSTRIHNRSIFWNNIVNKTSFIVDIIFDNLSWEQACEKEIELIKYYGRLDLKTGTLCNLTDGGDGTLNIKRLSENILKQSEKLKGRKHSEETKSKMRKSHTITKSRKGIKQDRSGRKRVYEYDSLGNYLQEWTCAAEFCEFYKLNSGIATTHLKSLRIIKKLDRVISYDKQDKIIVSRNSF